MKTNSFSLFVILVIVSTSFASCISIKEIGRLNLLSARNVDIDHVEYRRIATYAGESKTELKKSRAATIQQALNATIRNYPGGELMANAKIWLITKGGKSYFAVSGDILAAVGNDGEIDRSHRGFSIGDKVIWSEVAGKFCKGVIESHVDNETCIVQREDGKLIKQKYDKLTKTE